MKDTKFVAIDLETTGKYPLSAEICEVAMIKFDHTGVLERFETLVRPERGMTKESEAVHGLSLESLKGAPKIEEVVPKIIDFTQEASLLGHNLPFDLGFLAFEFDKYYKGKWWLEAFKSPNFCTSLISLQTHPKLTTHRLKYLTEYFSVPVSPNHRAMQDAEACMEVFFKITKEVISFEELVKVQKDSLLFEEFSTRVLMEANENLKAMVQACEIQADFELMYSKGSKKNKWRKLKAKGLVMKTKGDSFVVGVDEGDVQTKRFMLDKIVDTKV
ncbi:MAG: 3'-5' exonuclease [Bdellovibrionales bacterium]